VKKIALVFLALVLAYKIWAVLFGPVMFNVVVLNTGETPLNRVALKFERFNFRFGIMPKAKGDATYGMQMGPWPKTLTATWIIEGHPEKEFSQELIVPERLHAGRKEVLDLVVEFQDDGPHAYPRVLEDLDHGLSYRYKD
jgi:hypothetical protein